MATQELTFKVNFDPSVATAEVKRFSTSVEASLRQVGLTEKQQIAAAQSLQRQKSAALISLWKQEEREAARTANTRLREESRALRQKIAEEQRAAREVARINAETVRQAAQQERIREQAAKRLADVQIREAKRAAKELEQSLRRQGGSDGSTAAIGLIGRIPGLQGVSSELSGITAASAGAGAATASLAGPIGLAVAAFVAEAAAVTAVTKGLFDLTKQTAEFQGRLFDMSQQVGVSTETLSAFEILSTTTGGSLETVIQSLAIFQRNLEDSHDPTSKEAKLLHELGVSSDETEEALRQTLKALFDMGEGAAQTAAVLQLFGRGGRFVNAILKESHGNLDEAIRRFEELGLVVSTDAAKAADEFNDTLATLDFQLRGLRALIGNQVMPVILDVLNDLQTLLKDNKEAVDALASGAQLLAAFIGAPLKGAIIALNTVLQEHKAELILIKELYESITVLAKEFAGQIPEVDQNAIPEQLSKGIDGIKLMQELQRAFQAGLRPHNLREIFGEETEKKAAADPGVALLRSLQSELRKLSGETRAQEVAQQLLDTQFKNTNQQLREQIIIAARLIDIQKLKLDVDKKIKEETEKRTQEIIKERDAVNNFIFAQEKALRNDNTELQKTREFLAQIATSSGNISGILDEATIRLIRMNAVLLDSKKRVAEMLDLMRQFADLVPSPGGENPELPEIPAVDVGTPPPPDFSPWKTAIREIKQELLDFSQFAATAIRDSVLGIADALAHGVESWALYGESISKAMKKALAASLARIAGEATFQGALHAAYAIGSLALLDFRGAAQHAIAAAKFFAVAAATGIGARAIAGNTFQQSGSGSSGGGAANAPQPLNTIVGRNQRQTQVLEIRVKDSEFGRAVTAHVVRNIGDGGEIREVIQRDGR